MGKNKGNKGTQQKPVAEEASREDRDQEDSPREVDDGWTKVGSQTEESEPVKPSGKADKKKEEPKQSPKKEDSAKTAKKDSPTDKKVAEDKKKKEAEDKKKKEAEDKKKKEAEAAKKKKDEEDKKKKAAAQTDKKKDDKASPKKEESKNGSKNDSKKQPAKVVESELSEEESPNPKKSPENSNRSEDASPSPDAYSRSGRKDAKSKSRGRPEKEGRETKVKPKEKEVPSVVDWIQANLKTIIIVSLITVLFVWVKLKEDTFNRMYIGSAEQASTDLYELLGVTSSADIEEIKKGYKQRATELHPDKNPNCVDCQDKFNMLTKAYETLSNEETRKFYDTTNGIVNQIKSATHSLTLNNFRRLVEESNDIWIIMIYLDTDEISAQLTNFWDEVAKEYPFIKFGRINYATQAKLISMMPFRIEEIPFVMSYLPNKESDYLEFDANVDLGPQLRKFVKNSIEKRFTENSVEEIKAILAAPQTSKPTILQVTRAFTPVSFSYLAYKFGHLANFMISKTGGDHRRLYSYMDTPYIDYVIRLPEGLDVKGKKTLSFRFGSEAKPPKEADHFSIFPFVKFLSIPELRRSSFNEFCNDYTTSEETQSIKPSVCIVAFKSSSLDSDKFMQLFREEQKSLLPTFFEKTSEKALDIFDAVKSVQFATIDVDANKKFRNFVEEKSGIKNPRAMVYISAINKVKFYNNDDSLADDFEDIVKGSSSSFKHVQELMGHDEPLNNLLLPDSASVLKVLVRSILNWFTSVFTLTLAGVAILGLGRYSDMKYHITALIVAGTFLAVGLFEGLLHSSKLGLL